MTRQATDPAFSPASPPQDPQPRSRVYVFAVVTLAVVLTGMLVFPKSARHSVVETILAHECRGASAESAWRRSQDPRPEIVEHCRRIDAAAASQLYVAVPSQEGPTEGPRHIVIRCQAGDADRTMQVLQQVTDAFIQAHDRPADTTELDARRGDLISRARFWEGQWAATTQELESWVARELQRRRVDSEQARPSPGADGSPLAEGRARTMASPPSIPTAQTPSAKWQNLQEQLADADIRLQRLRLTHTEEHPLVIEARRLAEGLRDELAATPQTLTVVPDPKPFVPSAALASPPDPAAIGEEPAPFDEAPARQSILKHATAQALQASLEEIRAKRQAVEQQLQQLPTAESLLAERAWVVQSPRIIRSRPARAQAASLPVMFLPAVVLGIFCALLPQSVVTPDYLYSTEDASRSLQLAVRGSLATGDGPSFAAVPSQRIPALARRCVTASEIAIGLGIVLVFMCSLLSPGFAESVLRDPLDALGSTFQRLGIHR